MPEESPHLQVGADRGGDDSRRNPRPDCSTRSNPAKGLIRAMIVGPSIDLGRKWWRVLSRQPGKPTFVDARLPPGAELPEAGAAPP